MMDARASQERTLRDKVTADSTLKASAGTAWDDIARAETTYREILQPYVFLEGAAGFNSSLFNYARVLVRAADERTKPNPERLREYTDAQLPQLRQHLAADVPVYPELERSNACASISDRTMRS